MGRITSGEKNKMIKIELNPTGGEFDFCPCGESGDNQLLYKVVNTNKFICANCESTLREYADETKKILKNYEE